MEIPDFQSIMLPLLRRISDGEEHTLRTTVEELAEHFDLTAADLRVTNKNGAPRFYNRVAWSELHMKRAGLLESTGRGRLRITPRGRELLGRNPERVDLKLLEQFPEYLEFRGISRKAGQHGRIEDLAQPEPSLTPEELLESSYMALRGALALDLLERVKRCPPRFFEKLVVDLLLAMGYGGSREEAGEVVGRSGDEGIDGVIKQDKLGLDVVYIQAKRWAGSVGRPVVQAFSGSLDGQGANKGVMITTSHFSGDANQYAERIHKNIVLIGGNRLAELMIDHGIGVTEVETYHINRIDTDYFEDEG